MSFFWHKIYHSSWLALFELLSCLLLGSPYAIEVKGSPGSGTIKVYGPGLESGVFPDYQGHFFVDATGAGGGELHVSVMGLKGTQSNHLNYAYRREKNRNGYYTILGIDTGFGDRVNKNQF